jgi:hypothetical protein
MKSQNRYVVLKTIRRTLYARKEINLQSRCFTKRTLLEAKKGFADRQIAHMVGCLESQRLSVWK